MQINKTTSKIKKKKEKKKQLDKCMEVPWEIYYEQKIQEKFTLIANIYTSNIRPKSWEYILYCLQKRIYAFLTLARMKGAATHMDLQLPATVL